MCARAAGKACEAVVLNAYFYNCECVVLYEN